MECERFKKLVKSWYLQVQDESLAPARMVGFMKQHVADCKVCLMDPVIGREVDKITEIILPPSKARPPSPAPKEKEIAVPAAAAAAPEEAEELEEVEEGVDEEDEEAEEAEEEEEEEF